MEQEAQWLPLQISEGFCQLPNQMQGLKSVSFHKMEPHGPASWGPPETVQSIIKMCEDTDDKAGHCSEELEM